MVAREPDKRAHVGADLLVDEVNVLAHDFVPEWGDCTSIGTWLSEHYLPVVQKRPLILPTRNGKLIGESIGSVLEKIVWRNPSDGRLVAFYPEPGEPFWEKSDATGHYFAAPNCDESSEHHTDYFYQGEEVWQEALDDPLCIQHPFFVDGGVFYGYVKTGEAQFRYRSERVPITVNPEKKCHNWISGISRKLAQGHLVAADIHLPPGPYVRKRKAKE